MTQPHPQEYIITDKMIKAWRNGCAKGIQIGFDDSRCLDCEFCGKGARYHCCDFDDVDVEKMLRSRPHTPAAPAANCDNCPELMAKARQEGAKAAREQVLDKKNITIIRKGCLHPYWETCGGLNCCQHFVEKTGDCLFDVDAFIESLRGGAP